MQRVFVYGRYRYDYRVEFAQRRTLVLEVWPNLRIVVKAPHDAAQVEIEAFLVRKWRWLEKQLGELRQYQKSHAERTYISGESLYYLGRQYMLLVEPGVMESVKLRGRTIKVTTTRDVRDGSHNGSLIEGWYAFRRRTVFRREYMRALRLFDFARMPQLGERAMARRWGSYTSDGKVLLNPRLIEAPREAVRYVCIHELCHAISRDHDETFYAELSRRIPEWRVVKEALEIRFG